MQGLLDYQPGADMPMSVFSDAIAEDLRTYIRLLGVEDQDLAAELSDLKPAGLVSATKYRQIAKSRKKLLFKKNCTLENRRLAKEELASRSAEDQGDPLVLTLLRIECKLDKLLQNMSK